MSYKVDFLAMKPAQRSLVTQAIVIAELAVSEHNGNGHIWRETMKRRALGGVGRVRRFYRYLSKFDDNQIAKFLNAFAE
jgi:hypothetical protein